MFHNFDMLERNPHVVGEAKIWMFFRRHFGREEQAGPALITANPREIQIPPKSSSAFGAPPAAMETIKQLKSKMPHQEY